jgi:hypothetical protein
MSEPEKALLRIEEALAKLGDRQDAMCGELVALREQVAQLAGRPAAKRGAASAGETQKFLDRFRAGEALGEASFGAWIAVSDVACVRGGLRVAQQREGFHARLLEARLRELGGRPSTSLPQRVADEAMRKLGDPACPDRTKLLDFLKSVGDAEAALAPIFEMADRLDHDPETQSLLRAIAQDERSTLELLQQACQQLNA